MKDLHSDDNEEESDEVEDNDNDSEMERPVNRGGSRSRRWVSWKERGCLWWSQTLTSPAGMITAKVWNTKNGSRWSHSFDAGSPWHAYTCFTGNYFSFFSERDFSSKNFIGKSHMRCPCPWKCMPSGMTDYWTKVCFHLKSLCRSTAGDILRI